MTDSHDTSHSGLETAAKRLNAALSRLESRFDRMVQNDSGEPAQPLNGELAEAAAAASEAMADAIAALQSAIEDAEQAGGDG